MLDGSLRQLRFSMATGKSLYINHAYFTSTGYLYMGSTYTSAATSVSYNPYVYFASSVGTTYYPLLTSVSSGSTLSVYKSTRLMVSDGGLYIGDDSTHSYMTDLKFSIGAPTIVSFTGDGPHTNDITNRNNNTPCPMLMYSRVLIPADTNPYVLTVYGLEASEHGVILITDSQSTYYRNGCWFSNAGNRYYYYASSNTTYNCHSYTEGHVLAWREGEAAFWGKQTLAVTAFVEPGLPVYIYTNNMATSSMFYVKSSLYFTRS